MPSNAENLFMMHRSAILICQSFYHFYFKILNTGKVDPQASGAQTEAPFTAVIFLTNLDCLTLSTITLTKIFYFHEYISWSYHWSINKRKGETSSTKKDKFIHLKVTLQYVTHIINQYNK